MATITLFECDDPHCNRTCRPEDGRPGVPGDPTWFRVKVQQVGEREVGVTVCSQAHILPAIGPAMERNRRLGR